MKQAPYQCLLLIMFGCFTTAHAQGESTKPSTESKVIAQGITFTQPVKGVRSHTFQLESDFEFETGGGESLELAEFVAEYGLSRRTELSMRVRGPQFINSHAINGHEAKKRAEFSEALVQIKFEAMEKEFGRYKASLGFAGFGGRSVRDHHAIGGGIVLAELKRNHDAFIANATLRHAKSTQSTLAFNWLHEWSNKVYTFVGARRTTGGRHSEPIGFEAGAGVNISSHSLVEFGYKLLGVGERQRSVLALGFAHTFGHKD